MLLPGALRLFFLLSCWCACAAAQTYTVVPGDTLTEVALRHKTSVSQLMRLNDLSGTLIRVGQTLRLPGAALSGTPPSFRVHTVRAGETWSSIAADYELDTVTLERTNPDLTPGAPLLPGGRLGIPPERGALITLEAEQNVLGIALEHGLSPKELAELNGFVDLSSLEAGQRIFIPVRVPALTASSGPQPSSGSMEQRERLKTMSLQRVRRAPQLLSAFELPVQTYIWPLTREGRISSRFGRRNISVRGNTFHAGVDIAAPPGTAIRAVQSGVVTRAGWGDAYGYVVYVEHPSGAQTRYAHMRRVAVFTGQRVQQGDTLGEVGSTGASTGPHLHLELRFGGYAVDPLTYLER